MLGPIGPIVPHHVPHATSSSINCYVVLHLELSKASRLQLNYRQHATVRCARCSLNNITAKHNITTRQLMAGWLKARVMCGSQPGQGKSDVWLTARKGKMMKPWC
jgi:hypothetical protein